MRRFAQSSFRLHKIILAALFAALVLPISSWAQWNETVLRSFIPGRDGTFPATTFVSDPGGNLYGTTAAGGSTNYGTVFELSPKSGGGWTETVIHTFDTNDGYGPTAKLARDSDGNLYGANLVGGVYGGGTVFELSPVSGGWQETILYSFTGGTDGGGPSGVILDAAGNLYGATRSGGLVSDCFGSGCGTIFELTPGSGGWSETVLYSFQGYPNDAGEPGPLIFDHLGNLYGASAGGTGDVGAVFELSPLSGGAWSETVIHNFTTSHDGSGPVGALLLGPQGNIYGATRYGGAHDNGAVFALSQASGSWTERILYYFTGTNGDGAWPVGDLIQQGGDLYGATTAGGSADSGTAFRLSRSTSGMWQENVLHSFIRTQEGDNLLAGLASDSAGNLYGTAQFGGVDGYGTAFELTAASGYSSTILHIFSGEPGGAGPDAGLAFDSAGNLYGTTFQGGAHNAGTVFQLVPGSSGWAEQVLHSFKGGSDGFEPEAPVVVDASGNLFGTTPFGGTPGKCSGAGCGTVYELTNSGGDWVETVLHSFTGTPDGLFPYGGLILDSTGNLYGTTYQGGSAGHGTVFEFTRGSSGWTETVLYNFTGGNDGGFPEANVIFDAAGNLYGTTESGGSVGLGTVFRLTPSSGGGWTEDVLYSFAGGTDSSQSFAGLVFDSVGNLYGTTAYGGSFGRGTVFELSPTSGGGWQETLLHTFTGGSDGGYLQAGLAIDAAGNLYGLAGEGGSAGGGVAFELSPSAGGVWTQTILYNFAYSNSGAFPVDNMIFDTRGNLYGTTYGSGTGGLGLAFELSP